MILPSSVSSSKVFTQRPFLVTHHSSFPKALKGILNRQLFCLERPSDCSPKLFAPRVEPVPTRGSLIDLTKEHSDVGRYRTRGSSIGTRHLAHHH